MEHSPDSTRNLELLSELVLAPEPFRHSELPHFNEADLATLEALASSNHVIVRAFTPLERLLRREGRGREAELFADALQKEQQRIDHALVFLEQICLTLDESGCLPIVIKSLDHWPDLGSDLDLYSDGDPKQIVDVMKSAFQAKVEDRSWGDRLANKWNFSVPGLPELVEIHIRRLGQTGEQTAITGSLSDRAKQISLQSKVFRVAAPEDRIIISTLQRMYRHFYIRICDIVDNARLVDEGEVDFAYLRSLGSTAGLWEGIATYLVIVSEYVTKYRGSDIPLPSLVTKCAKFGTDQVRFRRNFLRVSILPHSIALYAAELKSFLARGDLKNGLRLSLLPCLATAAALEQKITGSDKGIW